MRHSPLITDAVIDATPYYREPLQRAFASSAVERRCLVFWLSREIAPLAEGALATGNSLVEGSVPT